LRKERCLRALADVVERVERVRGSLAREADCPQTWAARILGHRRKLATAAIALLAAFLAFHVVFGANGTVVYEKKRDEYRKLQSEIDRLEKENKALAEVNKSLKSDPEAIEREAREQLRYAKPGEVILVLPGDSPAAAPANADARKR